MKTSFAFAGILLMYCITACSTIIEPNDISDNFDRQKIANVLTSKRWEYVAHYHPGAPDGDTLQIPTERRNEIEFFRNARIVEKNKAYGSYYGYWKLERNFEYGDTARVRWRLVTTEAWGRNEVLRYILFLSSDQLVITGRGGRHGYSVNFLRPI